jgi:hypothetical protein
MSQSNINSILFQWSGHSNLESITTAELETLVKANAYSPSLQLLLSKKYALDASMGYGPQIQVLRIPKVLEIVPIVLK